MLELAPVTSSTLANFIKELRGERELLSECWHFKKFKKASRLKLGSFTYGIAVLSVNAKFQSIRASNDDLEKRQVNILAFNHIWVVATTPVKCASIWGDA